MRGCKAVQSHTGRGFRKAVYILRSAAGEVIVDWRTFRPPLMATKQQGFMAAKQRLKLAPFEARRQVDSHSHVNQIDR